MSIKTFLVGCAAAILIGAGVSAIADDATTQPSSETHTSTRSRIIEPFNRLPDLTDDQKDKIKSIHAQAMEQEREIRQKETDDIMALLTDDQKKELTDMEAKQAAAKKADAAERRAKTEEEKAEQLQQQAGSTTQPSDSAK
jgi:Spy/CpxP family protein refolding chaperone